MKRKIYHGSSEIMEKAEFGYGKPYNDYGLGFYCTEQIDMQENGVCPKRKMGLQTAMKLIAQD